MKLFPVMVEDHRKKRDKSIRVDFQILMLLYG